MIGSAVRRRLRIEGVVQGVGFRPFAYGVATELGLGGFVANDGSGVVMEVEGSETSVRALEERLLRGAPRRAAIERIAAESVAARGEARFAIADSRPGEGRHALVSPDLATCDDCLREVFDPTDRRYAYAFTTCNACGPRYTIVREVPYDRPATAMADFPLCAACVREYHDPGDRRFHAQTIACPACGPRLRLLDRDGVAHAGDPVDEAAALLRAGAVLAVKGIGGYHVAAVAADDEAVGRLRARKHREAKPFAVMAPDLRRASALGCIGPIEEAILTSARRPIVLVERREGAPLAAAVAPRSRLVGLLLPYTPLHHLLARRLDAAIVLTSGNLSDAPIAYDDVDARARLGSVADAFLVHDRRIEAPADDSVVRLAASGPIVLRRARGDAPQPIRLPWSARSAILACGAGLKSTFCLATGRHAFVSPHVGDLDRHDTLQAFRDGIARYERLFGIQPSVLAHDLHPDYPSTRYARARAGIELAGVQHHHAHVVSCLADNGESGPLIGVAFDGLGLGADGTLWGGEFLLADACGFERAAHLDPLPMPGGTAAVRQPWRMAAAYLAAAGDGAPTELAVGRRNARHWQAVLSAAAAGVNAPLTSSAGRLFDAAAAILGLRDVCSYEGQAASELELHADPEERGAYRAGVTPGAPQRVRAHELVAALVADLRAGVPTARIAARFHNGLADVVARVCAGLRDRSGLDVVALSGGVFQNALLLRGTIARLEARGFRVLTHARLPPNDGGISVGQAAVAAARLAVAHGDAPASRWSGGDAASVGTA